jgi:hypothetical protein
MRNLINQLLSSQGKKCIMKTSLFKRVGRITASIIAILVLLFSAVIAVLYHKQEGIVNDLLDTANKDFTGLIVLDGSRISPFANFPYISIDLQNLRVFETKDQTADPVLQIGDVYIGFDIFNLISGDYQIKSIKLSKGSIHLVQYKDGAFNLLNAFNPVEPIEDPAEEFHLDIHRINLEQMLITKLNEESGLKFELRVNRAQSGFINEPDFIASGLESDFILTMLSGEDSTFIKRKKISVKTAFRYDLQTKVVQFEPSEVSIQKASFTMKGHVDLDDNANLDLAFDGSKQNFDLLLAFLPDDLEPTLNRYANQGDIFFKAEVKGPSINGHDPWFRAEFGCKDGFFSNLTTQRKLDELQFQGYFTNGEKRTAETMEFALQSIRARPEAGIFSGSLVVKNFTSPDIDLKLDSDFDLDFLAKFFNVEQLQDLRGHVLLKMNFHDIIDLERPELSIERFNESYFTELEVTDLGFKIPSYHLPFSGINIRAKMDGHQADIEKLEINVGSSDIALSGTVDDLPAIIHHTAIPVTSVLKVTSKRLDLFELTSGDTLKSKPFNEVLSRLNLDLKFTSSAKEMIEFENLPIGEFFIQDLDVTLQNYPHRLHDFRADILVDAEDFSIVDFSGEIDESDFHFSGKLTHYDLWFAEKPEGDTKLKFDFRSDQIQLKDLLAYNGVNHIPEDYRDEVLSDLNMAGRAELHFIDTVHSADIYIDDFTGKMKMHTMKFERFGGRFHLEKQRLTVEDFRGKIGNTTFSADLGCDLRKLQEGKTHSNTLSFRAAHLDFDQLFAWAQSETPPAKAQEHDEVFSVFDIPFPNLNVSLDIAKMTYHKYKITNLKGGINTTKDHKLYFDNLSLDIAGGSILANGYFSGENRNNIYLFPQWEFNQIDLDQLLIKFDNFGQDAVVSENLHGLISGKLTGKIHVHADLVPIIEDSEIQLAIEVINGRLDNYEPMQVLADYFQDKNLNRVHFDTLSNQLDLLNGELIIPRMRINSSLGFLEISGKQDLEMNMDYIVRVPWRMITSAGSQRLFGTKNKAEADQDDEIIAADPDRKTRFVNVRITGTPDDFKIGLVGRKKATGEE